MQSAEGRRPTTRDVAAQRDPERDADHAPGGGDAVHHHAVARRAATPSMTPVGFLARIDGKDADAIGEEPVADADAAATAGKTTEELCWDQLRTCYDPEIPVNIVDLGLVYSLRADAARRRAATRSTSSSRSRRRAAAWATSCARTSRASC